MRPLAKSLAILAAIATLVGSACGSAPPEQKLTAALASAPAPRELTPELTTTTTTQPAPAPTTSTTAAPRPVDRPARVRSTPQRITVPPASIAAPGDCLHGWVGLRDPVRTARAHACWDGLLAQYAWSTSKAFAVMMCESGGDPYNIGPPTRYGTAKGLMQVLPDGSFDPATNMAQAWEKYKARGWQPWVCQ